MVCCSSYSPVVSQSDSEPYTRIGEKFLDWSDEDPSLDTILEALTLYWVTDTIANCLYPYREVSSFVVILSDWY